MVSELEFKFLGKLDNVERCLLRVEEEDYPWEDLIENLRNDYVTLSGELRLQHQVKYQKTISNVRAYVKGGIINLNKEEAQLSF